jgi:hypothetical protein
MLALPLDGRGHPRSDFGAFFNGYGNWTHF